MAQTSRANKELSIFQHFTISNKYNDEVEKNFVPEPAPIDISQEECSQIETDLKQYLENGQRIGTDNIHTPNALKNLAQEYNTSFYVEANQGNWERIELASPGATQRTDGIYAAGYHTVYAQPKPITKNRAELPERLIKLKIEQEIGKFYKVRNPKNVGISYFDLDKAQFNTLSKLIDLGDFNRMKPRAPKNLVERIFKPVSVDRKPFILKKWQSPFYDFKQKQHKRGNARSLVKPSN